MTALQLAPLAPGFVELHRHLDGSLRPETMRELARRLDVPIPEKPYFTDGMGLQPALALFGFSLSLLQRPDEVRRVASEICEDAAAEGVTTLELRFAPQLHRGADPAAIVDAALEGIAGRAGLILCGLYGESPAVLDGLIDVAISRPGVVGIDLAGGPTASDDFGMADYCGAFERARAAGLGRTVHAGEGRPPEEIRFAIESLFAQRIGHGTSILDDPEVVELARERAVVIEACPTSNVHTGIIDRVADHPMATWIDRGLLVSINTDNTLFSRTDARAERERCLAIEGMTEARIRDADAVGRRAAFERSGASS